MLWQHESTTKQDGRHVYYFAHQGMLGQAITMHDVTLQVVLFTVCRYIGLIECVWFCNETPDLYRETVTQRTLH